MTATINWKAPQNFSDATLPRFPSETLPGTLLLVEPVRSAVVGVPATGAALPDLAGRIAGAGAYLKYNGMSGASGLIERSSKGGIHGICTQTAVAASVQIQPNETVLQYLLDNITHRFYFSVWYLLTRAGLSGSEAHFAVTFSASPSATELLLAARQDNTWNPTATFVDHFNDPASSLVGAAVPKPVFASGDIQGYTGTVAKTAAATLTSNQARLFNVGNSGAFGSTLGAGQARSAIFYRAYVEDLTVSGRVLADMQAADYASFQKEVLTAGGRYFGDTYTNPSTLP